MRRTKLPYWALMGFVACGVGCTSGTGTQSGGGGGGTSTTTEVKPVIVVPQEEPTRGAAVGAPVYGTWSFSMVGTIDDQNKVQSAALTALKDEYRECGVVRGVVPNCLDSSFEFSTEKFAFGKEHTDRLIGVAAVHKETKQGFYLVRIVEKDEQEQVVHRIQVMAMNQSSEDADTAGYEAREKLLKISGPMRISSLESALNSQLAAVVYEAKTGDTVNFEKNYPQKVTARSFYHWLTYASENKISQDVISKFFNAGVMTAVTTASDEYKQKVVEFSMEQTLLSLSMESFIDKGFGFVNGVGNLSRNAALRAFKAEFTRNPKDPVKGMLALAITSLEQDEEKLTQDILSSAVSFYNNGQMSSARFSKVWDKEGFIASTRLGEKVYPYAKIIEKVDSTDQPTRIVAIRALRNYSGQEVPLKLLQVAVGPTAQSREVSDAVYNTLNAMKVNLGDYDVSSFIMSDRESQLRLTRALKAVSGRGADIALLKLIAQKDKNVSASAEISLTSRPANIGDFNVSSLISYEDGFEKSRETLATVMNHVQGSGANEAIFRLAIDDVSAIRSAAVSVTFSRTVDVGDLNVQSFILPGDTQLTKRTNIAVALKRIKGSGADLALLRLVVDIIPAVRNAALSSIQYRGIEVGNFDINNLVNYNTNYEGTRLALARALSKVSGDKVDAVLEKLKADVDPDVRRAAKKSFDTRISQLIKGD